MPPLSGRQFPKKKKNRVYNKKQTKNYETVEKYAEHISALIEGLQGVFKNYVFIFIFGLNKDAKI